MKDRQPTRPGRVRITPENGEAYYAVMEMADEPTEVGTPPTKANLLKDSTADLFGGDSNMVPDDALRILFGRSDPFSSTNLVIEKIFDSCNWVVPKAKGGKFSVIAVGGGGGKYGSGSGGGGGSGYIEKVEVQLDEGAVVPIVCGAGGAAGKDGGSTMFGAYVTAQGGKAGENNAGGDGEAGGGGYASNGKGGNGKTYGGGGGGGSGTSNACAPGGNGGTYGGGGGGNTPGLGGAFGGSGGGLSGGASNGIPFGDPIFNTMYMYAKPFSIDSKASSDKVGGGGGYGGNGGSGGNRGGGGGGGYGGNGGAGYGNGMTGGGGGGYGGNGGSGSSSSGGGGGGFFSAGNSGGGGGGFFVDASGGVGANGGVLIVYFKEVEA